MKLLFLPNNVLCSCLNKSEIYFSDALGSGYKYKSKTLKQIYFQKDIFWGVKQVKEKKLEVFIEKGADWRAEDVADSVIILPNEEKIDYGDITKQMLVYQIKHNALNYITFEIDKVVEGNEESFLVFYNLDEDEHTDAQGGGVTPRYYNGDFFCNGNSLVILRCDQNLNEIWRYDGINLPKEIEPPKFIDNTGVRKVINLKQSVIYNFSCERSQRKRIEKHDLFSNLEYEPWFLNGELYCFDNETGDVKWTTTFPLQIDDIELTDSGNVMVACERYLYVINPDDGAVIEKLDTKIRSNEYESQISISLLNHQGYLFVFSFKDCVLQILDSSTFEVLRTINEQERGWRFARYRPKVIGSHVIVPIEFAQSPFNSGAIFVIDANDIHAEVEVEEQPKFDITVPTESSPGIITCNVDHPDWAIVLRMAEIQLFEHILSFLDVERSKYFNPRKVEINYSGYQADKQEVEDKFKIFKTRFENYVQKAHVPGITVPAIELEYILG